MSENTGGSATTEGLIYQAEVCVWAALELLLVQRATQVLDLEPTSHEDLEANIDPEDADGATVTSRVDGYRLILQVKLRNTGPWSNADFTRLLDHGVRRTSPRTRLTKDATSRYLLVTTADVANDVARNLLVDAFGSWPAAATQKPTYQPFASGADARLAILGGATPYVVQSRITDLLRGYFRIPADQMKACRKALHDEALTRSRAGADSRWTRADLTAVLKRHQARWLAATDLDAFVEPDNWPDIVAKAEAGAILIRGQSGSGKTYAAEKLCDHLLRRGAGPLSFGKAETPSQFEELARKPPVLVYAEDPWGKYDPSPDTPSWNRVLDLWLPRAGNGLHFVITSRTDVLGAAGAIDERLARWTVDLNADDYSDARRKRLFDNRLSRLDAPTQLMAGRWRKDALAVLDTPLEIERYFVALTAPRPADETELDTHQRALTYAHHTTFEAAVADEVSARGDVGWAAVIWAALKTGQSPSLPWFKRMRRDLAARLPHLQSGLEALIAFLVAGRSLRQSDKGYAYAHPRVEAGLGRAMDRQPEIAEDVLAAVADVLVSWGGPADLDGAARLLAVWRREAETRPAPRAEPSTASQAAVDAYLAERLVSVPAETFAETFELAAEATSAASPLGELARWLVEIERSEDWMTPSWAASPRAPEWFAATGAALGANVVLDRFVSEFLVADRRDYPASLADKLAAFGHDLGAAFRTAAHRILGRGYDGRAAAVVTGALADLDAALPLAREAAEELNAISASPGTPRETYLPLVNGVYDDEYAMHMESWHEDDGYVASELLGPYVERLRQERGWRALTSAGFGQAVLWPWRRALADVPAGDIEDAELEALLDLAAGTHQEDDVIRILIADWREQFEARVADRLLDPDIAAGAWSAAAQALAAHAPDRLREVQDQRVAAGSLGQAIRLHRVLGGLEGAASADPSQAALQSALPADLAQIVGMLGEADPLLDGAARARLAHIEPVDLETAGALDRLPQLLTLAANTWSRHSRRSDEDGQFPIARIAAGAVRTLRPLDHDAVTAVAGVAFASHDPEVRRLLFEAIALGGEADGRERLLTFALKEERSLARRRDAIRALTAAAPLLDASAVTPRIRDLPLDGRLFLSPNWTLLMAAVADEAELVSLATRLAGSVERRSLLLLVDAGRFAGLGGKLAPLLPDRHPARALFGAAEIQPLPRTSVDDLGDARLIDLVRTLRPAWFGPRPKPSWRFPVPAPAAA